MTVIACPKCGGDHYGSNACPFDKKVKTPCPTCDGTGVRRRPTFEPQPSWQPDEPCPDCAGTGWLWCFVAPESP